MRFFHGTSTGYARELRAGAPLVVDIAVEAKLAPRARPGFYLGTEFADAEFFAIRRGAGRPEDVIVVEVEEVALTSLLEDGATLAPLPHTGRPPFFTGDELYVPITAFATYNRLRAEGLIHVRG